SMRRPCSPINSLGRVTATLEISCPISVRSRFLRSVSTSGSSGMVERRHLLPVLAGLQLDFERHAQVHRAHHDPPQLVLERWNFCRRDLEDQLVVDLEDHPRRELSLANEVVNADYRDFHDVAG